MKLYTYFRSTAAYRVRIALNMKDVAHELVPVHLLKNGGENRAPAYLAKNPQGRVPALEVDVPGGTEVLAQSLALLEYLEEVYPDPPILPGHPLLRAKVRAIANLIACDIHPLNNIAVLGYLKSEMGQDQAHVDAWYAHWITKNFTALEQQIDGRDFCVGEHVTMADICLVPQVFNARRFKVPVDAFPKIVAVEQRCLQIDAFARAAPENQPDAE